MRLIWCQGGNPRSARIAVEAGLWYGFRSDGNWYTDLAPVALLDCRWDDRLDWPRHLAVCTQVRPWLATVPDVMGGGDLERALHQAEQLAPHCDRVLVVPKATGVIYRLPREVHGKPVVLGYSVPTGYGASPLPLWDFKGWPVHLLGGSAPRQLDLCGYLDVVSADGNVAWRLARRGIVVGPNGRGGKTLLQADGRRWGADGHLEALRRSLVNLRAFWDRHARIQWRVP